MTLYSKVVVGYDGSENSKRALRKGVELVKNSNGELIVVFAVDIVIYSAHSMVQFYGQIRDSMLEHAKNLLSEAPDIATLAGIKASRSVREGPPADMILAQASESKADLIIVGRRGMRGVERFLMGSVSSRVVNHSECDVLVVK